MATKRKTAENIDLLTVVRAASELVDRAQLAAQAGITFGGSRDLYDALGYKRLLTVADFRDRYKRGGIGARIVEAFPRATWRGGIEIVEDEDPEIITDFEEQFEEFAKRLNIWSVFNRADVLAGLGRYSVIVIGTKGNLNEELPRMSSSDDILYLGAYCEDEASISAFEENAENPRYGLPTVYKIRRSSGNNKLSIDRNVHWTRVIHVADNLLDDRIYGASRLERVWNDLDNLDKVVGGGSEAFWLRVHRGTVFSIAKDLKASEPELEKMRTMAEDLAHQMRRSVAARGLEVTELGSDVSNFNSQVEALISLISGATQIPQRILLGSERGELASTQDKENWNVRVQDRRQEFAEPIVRGFIDRLIEYGALPEPDQYDVRWPDLFDLNEDERANVATKWAGLSKAAGDTVVTAEEIRDRVLKLPRFTPEQIAKIEEDKARKIQEQQDAMKKAALQKGPDNQQNPPDKNADQQVK